MRHRRRDAHSPADTFDAAAPTIAPASRPMGRVAAVLARPALRQLQRMATADPSHAELYDERAVAIRARFASLSAADQWQLALARCVDTVVLWRGWLNALIHPSTQFYTAPVLPLDDVCDALVAQREARRIHFFTRDHVLLDGLLVGAQSDTPLPVAVLALGNAMFHEALIHQAHALAAARGMRVLLYNDRGVGRSTGGQYSTSQGVTDCRSALNAALSHSNGTIDVFGISLGAGKAAVALQQARDAGELTPEQVRTYVNCHSFKSLSACIGQLMGVVVGFAARALFALGGMSNLDAEAAIRSGPLARRTVVFTAANDTIIRGSARVKEAFAGETPPPGVAFFDVPGKHNDIDAYFRPRSSRHKAWAPD